MELPKIPKFKPLAEAGQGTKNVLKPILIGAVALLLGAFGLEVSNNDWNLNSIFGGQSVSESKIIRDESGNIKRDAAGNIVTRVMRDKLGNIVQDNTPGAKYTDEYNCDDFKTQPEAQAFFEKAGGIAGDVNRLDGDKNGVACQDLPKERK